MRQFPLAPINSRLQHQQALKVLHGLMLKSKLTAAESDYFQVLSGLIQKYETATVSASSATPQQVLEFLMEQHQLGQAEISKITNVHPPHISEFMGERRNLPRHAAAKLADYFKVDPSIFLPKITAASPQYEASKSAELGVGESASSGYKAVATRSRGRKSDSTKKTSKSAHTTKPKRRP
ncbi:MAG TPA: hypothetical protein V6D22_13950 [Candidatus Obscuribacterales bacterium]